MSLGLCSKKITPRQSRRICAWYSSGKIHVVFERRQTLIRMQTYAKTEAYKLSSKVFWIFLSNIIKIDPYNFELYRFKVYAFFWDTVYCAWWMHVIRTVYIVTFHCSIYKRASKSNWCLIRWHTSLITYCFAYFDVCSNDIRDWFVLLMLYIFYLYRSLFAMTAATNTETKTTNTQQSTQY